MWWCKANEQWNQLISAHLCRKGQTVSEPSSIRIGVLSLLVTRTLLKVQQPPDADVIKSGVKSEHTTTRNRFGSQSMRFFSLPKCCLLWSCGRWGGEVFKLSLLKLVLPGRCRDITVEPKRSDRRYLDLLLMVVPVEKGGFLQGWTSRGQLPHSPGGHSGTSWVWCLPPQSSQLCICSALGRKDFCFPPFSLLEREKISGLDTRHIERMRHHGRHQALC